MDTLDVVPPPSAAHRRVVRPVAGADEWLAVERLR